VIKDELWLGKTADAMPCERQMSEERFFRKIFLVMDIF
jgi:hypothetical protein